MLPRFAGAKSIECVMRCCHAWQACLTHTGTRVFATRYAQAVGVPPSFAAVGVEGVNCISSSVICSSSSGHGKCKSSQSSNKQDGTAAGVSSSSRRRGQHKGAAGSGTAAGTVVQPSSLKVSALVGLGSINALDATAGRAAAVSLSHTESSSHAAVARCSSVTAADAANAAYDSSAAAPTTLSARVPVPDVQDLAFSNTEFDLRHYQVEAVQQVVTQFKEGTGVQLIMLPTGCGKTVVFAALARYLSQYYEPPTASAASVEHAAANLQLQLDAAAETAGPASCAALSAQQGDSYAQYTTGNLVDQQLVSAGATVRRKLRSARLQHKSSTAAQAADSSSNGTAEGTVAFASRPEADSSNTGSGSSSATGLAGSTIGGGNITGSSPRSSADSGTSSIDDSSTAAGGTAKPQQGTKGADAELPSCQPGKMRVLVLAHRHELLRQAEEKFGLMWPGVTVSWIKGPRKEYHGQVVVASVMTAINCIPDLVKRKFSLVIVDEAHHSTAATYKELLQGLGFIQEVTDGSSSSNDTSNTNMSDKGQTAEQADHQQSAADKAANVPHHSCTVSASAAAAAGAAAVVTGSESSAETMSASDGDSDVDEFEPAQLVPKIRSIYNPNALCVGFTATPYRFKKDESQELYQMFAQTYAKNITDMIRARHLCKVLSRKVLTHVDLKGIVSQNGDFVASRLSPVINSADRNQLVLQAYIHCCTAPTGQPDSGGNTLSAECAAGIAAAASAVAATATTTARVRTKKSKAKPGQEPAAEMVNGYSSPSQEGHHQQQPGLSMAGRQVVRKTLGFAVDIAHAEALDELFSAAGVRSSLVHSQLPFDDIKQRVKQFREGGLDLLWNCEQLTEGFDEPSITALLMTRPTKSTGLYTQMLGRGLRLWPDKQDCLVLDFTDKFHRVDKIVDTRVLLDDSTCVTRLDPATPAEAPADRTTKFNLTGVMGGEMDVLSGGVNPMDFAWVRVGPHWTQSMFNLGTVWLVNTNDMAAKQRRQLGLENSVNRPAQVAEHSPEGERSSSDWSAADDEDASPYYDNDRYVVLHQLYKGPSDPLQWTNVAPSAVQGLSQSDAYGVAIDYVLRLVQRQQAREVAAWRAGQRANRRWVSANTLKKDHPWRSQNASDKQLQRLREYKVPLPAKLTKGQASDLIAEAMNRPAPPELLQRLKAVMCHEDLPVPLLETQAEQLLKSHS